MHLSTRGHSSRALGAVLTLLFALSVAACTEAREDPVTPEPQVDPACLGCHGDSTTPAPRDAAHRAHLDGSARFEPVACEDCHLVPATPSAVGHADSELPADVVLGGAAAVPDGGEPPSWDPESGTCAQIACHGAALAAPVATERDWWAGALNLGDCASCHASPPGGEHPASGPAPDGCVLCHGNLTPALHGDGVVKVALPTDCGTCHGDEVSPAPQDGLHRKHVLQGARTAAVACATCHTVYEEVMAPGHLDPAPAEVELGLLAAHDGATPSWTGGSCASTYCHSGAAGGTHPTPPWANTGGQAAACGACHGEPPPAPHPQIEACADCHGEVISEDGAITAPERHVDGILDVDMPTDCNGCHGTVVDPAPPDPGHVSHRAGTLLTGPIDCVACHITPDDVLDPGHVDSGAPAEVTFGGLAVAAGATPTYDGASCADVYCHSTPPAGPPIWGDVTGTWSSCDACHGAPPAADHPLSDQCDVCHAEVAGPDLTITALELHVDGQLQWAEAACDSCHGAAGTDAPDQGAHLAHLEVGVACAQCHVVPAAADVGHLDSAPPAEVTFGSIAKANGSTPAWSAATATCSNAWCHDVDDSAATPKPTWDDDSGAPGDCGACHGLPPSSAVHAAIGNKACTDCHTSFPDGHVDGTTTY